MLKEALNKSSVEPVALASTAIYNVFLAYGTQANLMRVLPHNFGLFRGQPQIRGFAARLP